MEGAERMTTYSATLTGVPGLAVRLGRAIELWGRRAARRPGREAQRREFDRLMAAEARRRDAEVHGLLHR